MGLFASAGRAIAFMGPAGLVIAGAAGLTYLGMVAGDAFKTTDMYKDLCKYIVSKKIKVSKLLSRDGSFNSSLCFVNCDMIVRVFKDVDLD